MQPRVSFWGVWGGDTASGPGAVGDGGVGVDAEVFCFVAV